MDTSDRGLWHPFIGHMAVAYGLTGIENALVKCAFSFSIAAEYTRAFKYPHR